MNDSSRKVSPLRQRMIEEMRMRQLAPKTRDAYIRAVLHFTRFLGRSPDTATAEDLRRYQLHCVDQGISAISLNATITGLKFLFDATLGQPELMARMHPVRMSRTLPIILSRVANARRLVLQNVPFLARQSPLERTVPLRAWLATDTHRSRSPDAPRLTGFCPRSNPHRSATLLIGISTSPRFPPWRLVQHLPPSLTGLGRLSAHRQVSDNP